MNNSNSFTPTITPYSGGVSIGGYTGSGDSRVSYGGSVNIGRGGVTGACIGV